MLMNVEIRVWNHILFLPILAAVWGIAVLILKRTPDYMKGDKLNKICVALTELFTFLLYIRHGWTMDMLRGIALSAVALFGSVSDIKKREMPDVISIMIFFLGFRQANMAQILTAFLSAVGAFVFMLVCAVLSNNKIGGADVKYIAAWFYVSGAYCGIIGLLAGLVFSLIGTAVRNVITKNKDKYLPLIPYLSAGFLITYLF